MKKILSQEQFDMLKEKAGSGGGFQNLFSDLISKCKPTYEIDLESSDIEKITKSAEYNHGSGGFQNTLKNIFSSFFSK